MADTSPRPRRRLWPLLLTVAGLLLAAVTAIQIHDHHRETQRIRLIADLKQTGAFAQLYIKPSESPLARLPMLEEFFDRTEVLLYVPDAESAEAVLPMLTDDITRIEIRGPARGPLFTSLSDKFRTAAPHAEVLSRTRHEP
ncbi:hypothetical protein Pan44_31300 [Caulifigura coniformis]|uniref:Uncharacterized protein n=1 Tax=Caulifigura coniformis TaxID=2527983 RepID=A0A517SG32_9PLAN|nr:hypothetical protein [Caulifigura coniformis]QDT55089.1 hypothetical protein Pan44_31300 [Caulifigura coniformis]